MGWFIRKAIRLGPLRLNLSRSGLGASVGVKGLRIGQDAHGHPYVFGGRGGLYFRERLGRSGAPSIGLLVALVLGLLILAAIFLH